MNVQYAEPVEGHSESEIRVGEASWDPDDISVKYASRGRNGQVTRSGEVPVWALPQMLTVAIREGYLTL